MNNRNGRTRIGSIITTLFLICILIISFNIFKKYYFNGFEKAVAKQQEETKFIRDSKTKYSQHKSYKIENVEYNDAAIYKEIEVEPYTPYKISCMVKTDDVKCETEKNDGGVVIGLLETTEYSEPIVGTNDWQKIEFMFNSKNREKVKISFRIGGNDNNCKGTAWFSDFKVEKGTKNTDSQWNIGCFIIKNIDTNINGKQYTLRTNAEDVENVKLNMKRFKETCNRLSDEKITINYEITQIDTTITTISYSEEHGYYISYNDVKNLIYDTVKEKEYDHVFIVCRMEDDTGDVSIPIYNNWIGLGGMDIYGIGLSLIRINQKANSYIYKYGITNQLPEEVYIHEFLHTLERNNIENGYKTPSLHDYEKFGYTEQRVDGLNKWYGDYMKCKIIDSITQEHIGLDESVYKTQPPNSSNFQYPIDIEFNVEPKNIIEEIFLIFDVLLKR